MQIRSDDTTLQELLTGAYFVIPRFQRAYSWKAAQVEDFWHDTIVSDESDYFIGSFVISGDMMLLVG